ncbi:MAG: hypothetical protein GF372_04695, partial [Candidatus Marinimicrobia bacterium]|nr:hypothetical protein [Candidatus Neomarinimicrobiota bacterium]
ESNQIRFAIPMEYIPQPKRWWQYTVITGGQDDHNGGGIGEFREIKQNAHPWYGGGKDEFGKPNWYDILSFGY